MPPDFKTFEEGILRGVLKRDGRNRRAVLFVHGFTGGAIETWTSGGGSPSLLDLAVADTELGGFDVFAFEYSSISLSDRKIRDVAAQLDNVLETHLKKYGVTVVAHSMGGLVAMRAILNRLQAGRVQSIQGLLFYGVPLTGVQLANLAKLLKVVVDLALPGASAVRKILPRTFAVDLASSSDFLSELHTQWAEHVINGGSPELTQDKRAHIPTQVVVGTADRVVNSRSARWIFGDVQVKIVEAGHKELVKPKSAKSSSFVVLKQFLQGISAAAAKEVSALVRAACDKGLASLHGKAIQDWRFELRLFTGKTKRSALDTCEVATCQYETVLSSPTVRIGFAVGDAARREIWKSPEVAYVHHVAIGGLAQDQQDLVLPALRKVMHREGPVEHIWKNLFPKIQVRARPKNSSDWFELQGERVTAQQDQAARDFLIPNELREELGAPLVLSLSYESFIPATLSSFRVFFPWLTIGCEVGLEVGGPIRTNSVSHLLGVGGLPEIGWQTPGSGTRAFMHSSGVIFPDSVVQFSWTREAKGSTR